LELAEFFEEMYKYNLKSSKEYHKVVTENEWVESRRALLKKENEFTTLRDQLSQQQCDLSWAAVNKEYVFKGPNGKHVIRAF
jgi:predicted dithiol-disulfide oxidoreductase (DUF899 family)